MFTEMFLIDRSGHIIAARAKEEDSSFHTNALICFLKGMQTQFTRENIEDVYGKAQRIKITMEIVN